MPFDPYPNSGLSTRMARCEREEEGGNVQQGGCYTSALLTLPPFFIPKTAVESAGGGFGPPCPEKSPPALSVIFFAACSDTCSPATNSNGCKEI